MSRISPGWKLSLSATTCRSRSSLPGSHNSSSPYHVFQSVIIKLRCRNEL